GARLLQLAHRLVERQAALLRRERLPGRGHRLLLEVERGAAPYRARPDPSTRGAGALIRNDRGRARPRGGRGRAPDVAQPLLFLSSTCMHLYSCPDLGSLQKNSTDIDVSLVNFWISRIGVGFFVIGQL